MADDVKTIEGEPVIWVIGPHYLEEVYAEYGWAYPMSGDHHPRVRPDGAEQA